MDADANTYNIDIKYSVGSNSFTDKANLTLINSTVDDNPTQAAGRPLVGVDAIAAASLVSEDEDLTIYGNVGNAVIDVNGKSSAYDWCRQSTADRVRLAYMLMQIPE